MNNAALWLLLGWIAMAFVMAIWLGGRIDARKHPTP